MNEAEVRAIVREEIAATFTRAVDNGAGVSEILTNLLRDNRYTWRTLCVLKNATGLDEQACKVALEQIGAVTNTTGTKCMYRLP